MNSERDIRSDRATRLRSELIATVNAARYPRPRLDPRALVAAIAAFALAGALTGGAISATALAKPADSALMVDVEQMAETIVGTHSELFGTPVVVSGSGESVIEMGVRPTGATSIAIALSCTDAGEFTTAFNGRVESTLTCTREDAESNRENSVGMGFQKAIEAGGRQTLTIESGVSSRYVVWASWSAEQTAPEPSPAQTAELADGAVTREEYLAAFDRYAACMSDAGQPIVGIDKSGTVIDFSITDASVNAGIDVKCYAAEFKQVDMTWQLANEDTSEGTQMMRDCLVEAGMTPAPTTAEIFDQLQSAGLVESCH